MMASASSTSQLFREYALANLASKLHLYHGQSFEVTGAKVVSDQDALVTSRILSTGSRRFRWTGVCASGMTAAWSRSTSSSKGSA